MASPRQSRPPNGFGRVSSMASSASASSSHRGQAGLARSSTMSTVSDSTYAATETSRAQFQDELNTIMVALGIPLTLPRPLLTLPSQRAVPLNASDKTGAEQFLMSLRPKRVLLGKSSKGFARDEVLLALDKAVGGEQSVLIIEALLQLVETSGSGAGSSSSAFTTDKKGHAIPTLEYLFSRAEHFQSLDIWRLFLGRVSQRALDASLANTLKDRTGDIKRIRYLLEYGANPELCQDQILNLIETGSEELVEILLLSPLLTNVEFLSHGLVKAAAGSSLRKTSMLLLRGADANFSQASALKGAVAAQKYSLALAIVTLAKTPVSSSNLDDATGLIGTWSKEIQKPFLKMFLYTGASGPRMSKTLVPFIAVQEEDIASILIECPAFRHSTFPTARLFKFAIDSRNFALALQVLRSSNNRSFSDYASIGVHLQLVQHYAADPDEIHKIISELLTLGVSGDYTSQMLVSCCAAEQIESPNIIVLINLLIHTAAAKASYSDGAALLSAIEAENPAVVGALTAAKPTKKILSSALSYTSSCLGDESPAKLEIWSLLLDAGASGVSADQELISAVDKGPHALQKVKVLLKGASPDYSEGKAVVRAVQLERLDLLEMILSQKTPQSLTFTSIWKQTRKLFALAESNDGHLPYNLPYMQKIFQMFHGAAKGAVPLNDLLLDATRCTSKDVALGLTKLLLRWGASPNHALGTPLQACIKRSDTETLAELLAVKTSKTSLKYAFMEALLLRQSTRHTMLQTIIGAGLEKASLDAALPQVLREDRYDSSVVLILVEAGARLHSSFGENLVPPSINLDLRTIERLLPSISDKDSILLPMKAVLSSRTDWQNPDGESLPMVKLLVNNCSAGTWADRFFITAVKSRNRHSARIFANHLTSDRIYSDALRELLVHDTEPLDREKLSMTKYLLKNGAKGNMIDESFIRAAQILDYEWVSTLYPYLSDRTVALSAFDLIVKGKDSSNALQGNQLEIVQFLLKQGLEGPVVDDAFVKAAAAADIKSMNEFLAFVTSRDAFSESLGLLAQQENLFTSREGLAAVEILREGASDVAVANAARTAARARSLAGVKLITRRPSRSPAMHAAFQGLMEHTEPLSSSGSRNILFYLLETGLDNEDAEHVTRLAASTFDTAIIKALAPLENSRKLHDIAVDTIALSGDKWLSVKGLELVEYLLGREVSGSAIHRLIETASIALHPSALQMLLLACDGDGKAVEIAFNAVVSDTQRWTSLEGLHIVTFLLEYGANGVAVEEAAGYAAETSNYDALDVFLKSPAAATAIPAAFKALTRRKPGQLSSEQLTIASTLVEQGVSTEILAIAAIEMAKLLDLEGLKVLSKSPRFRQVTDDVLRAILLSEDLWRSAGGHLIMQFLLEKGVSTKMVEVAASKATASLDIDSLRTVLESNSPPTVIASAFTSMTRLEKEWLCPEGLRIADYLLGREPFQANINTAFIQASQYLHFDAVELLLPHITDISVLNEALYRAVSTESEWLSALHLVKILLEWGAEGDTVEFALIKGARALDYASLELLSAKIERPEVYTKALAAATEDTQEWRRYPNIIEFLLQHGASGEPVDKAYLSASKALDVQAVTLLNPYIFNPDTHSNAFREAASNQSWLSPSYLDLLEFLYSVEVAPDVIGVALVSAAEAHNVPAVELLSRNADEDTCSKAFTAATRDVNKWTLAEGSQVVHILAERCARGDSVDEALINSARLFRLDLVSVLAQNVDKESVNCVSRALDALLSTDGPDQANPGGVWLSNPDALDILQILINMGANGDSAHDALVRAAQTGNTGAVDILAQVVNDPRTFTNAFNIMTDSSTLWLASESFDLVATLLSRGAAGEGVHYALASALTYVIDGVASQELLELLLQHDADVNFDDGKSLQLTTHHARQDLFEMLLQRNPDPHSLYMCLKAALDNDHDEETVFRLFKSVTGNGSVHAKPNVNHYSDLGLPLLFYSLNNYPTSARLADEICQLDANLSATIDWDIYDDEYDDPISDRISPLLVSLEKNCSDEVIGVLLKHGAQVNFISEQARASALMLAAGKGRASVVSTLIDHGASVIQKDARNRTPLCYAARNGDVSALESILKKKPPRNDGSLHEAARELHADAVKLLVKSGHDIHFPSSKHGGRSPLCELCCACRGSKDPVGLQETLTALAAAKAEPLRKCRGRTALFMAMENANPGPVVTALIEACLWRDLNDPQNVYEEGDHFYSPTMYIKKGIIRQPEAIAKDILEKLNDFSATDRYYAKERMQQPRDAVGMPQRILDLDHKKWIRSSRLEEEEEDFERKLKRADQEMANRQLLSQRQHLMLMEQRENLGQQQSAHTLDTHLLSMNLRDREHGLGLVHQEEVYDRRLGEMAAANTMKLNIEAAQHVTKSGMQQQSREAQLDYEGRTQKQKLGYLGEEQGMRYSGLEAQQQLKLQGISKELEFKQQQQADELRFRESRSGVDRADLDHKLQHTSAMNMGRVELNRELGDIEFSTRQNKNMLEDRNRQSQLEYQERTDERKIYTQDAMNQHEFARNQNSIETRRTQGQIDMDTRTGLSQIEQDTMYNKFQMTQQDRGHKLDMEDLMGQVQNQNLADKFLLTQQDRGHQLQTEEVKGQIQLQNLESKLSTNLNYLQHTHRENLGFQQATDQQKLGFQQNFDRQKLQTLGQEGRIQNNTLATKNHLNLDYQNRSGNLRLGEQFKSKQIDLNYQQRRLGQQAQGNNLEMQKQGFIHQNRMDEYTAQDHLNTRKVQGAYLMQQSQTAGNHMRHVDNLQYKQLGG